MRFDCYCWRKSTTKPQSVKGVFVQMLTDDRAVFLLTAINQSLDIFTLSIFRYNGRDKSQLSLYDVHQKLCGAPITIHPRINGYQTKMNFGSSDNSRSPYHFYLQKQVHRLTTGRNQRWLVELSEMPYSFFLQCLHLRCTEAAHLLRNQSCLPMWSIQNPYVA